LQAKRFHEAIDTIFRMKYSTRESWLLFCAAEDGDGAHANAGFCYLRREETDRAIQAFQQALDANPNDYGAELGLADAYQAKGMDKEAQAAAMRAAETKNRKK